MHASIAHALYRGERRQFAPRMNVAESRFKRMNVRHGRNAWMKNAFHLATNDPSFLPIASYSQGEKKHEVNLLIGFLHPDNLKNVDGWCGCAFILRAKTCSVERHDLPIKVSHHAVLRLMQRVDIANVHQALTWLLPAVHYILAVEPDPCPTDKLLPCISGGVIGLQDQQEPEAWVFVTYVDDDKLFPSQRTELEDRKRRLKEAMAALGLRKELSGRRGDQIVLA